MVKAGEGWRQVFGEVMVIVHVMVVGTFALLVWRRNYLPLSIHMPLLGAVMTASVRVTCIIVHCNIGSYDGSYDTA